MQGRARDRFPSDYASALARDPVLAPPTCCCCCCCCCTLVVPEATFGKSWANQVIQTYAAARSYPPLGEVMKAYAGGIAAGNLIFWVVALVIGFPLVLVTVGAYLVAGPLALLITLAVQGGLLGTRLARARGEPEGHARAVGALVGLGMGVLVLGGVVGILALILLVLLGAEPELGMLPFLLGGFSCLVGAILMIAYGVQARRVRPTAPAGWAPPPPPPPRRP